MTVYPDGDALSDRERRILEQIERDMEVDFEVLCGHGDLGPLHLFALYALVTEMALAFAAYVSMVAMATIAGAVWSGTVHRVQPSTARL